jgi:hypothetical protein
LPGARCEEHRRIELGRRDHRIAAVAPADIGKVAEECTGKLLPRSDGPSVDIVALARFPAASISSIRHLRYFGGFLSTETK